MIFVRSGQHTDCPCPDHARSGVLPLDCARLSSGSPNDIVEQLGETDRRGLAVFLSVSWDMTHPGPYGDRMRQITALMAELFSLYAGHASFAGFYSYQEGSGTYYVRTSASSPGT